MMIKARRQGRGWSQLWVNWAALGWTGEAQQLELRALTTLLPPKFALVQLLPNCALPASKQLGMRSCKRHQEGLGRSWKLSSMETETLNSSNTLTAQKGNSRAAEPPDSTQIPKAGDTWPPQHIPETP